LSCLMSFRRHQEYTQREGCLVLAQEEKKPKREEKSVKTTALFDEQTTRGQRRARTV
jgi:hypothetical protein